MLGARSPQRIANFYPRPLRRGRRNANGSNEQNSDFYPRPLRRGRQLLGWFASLPETISIHALFAEGDDRTAERLLRQIRISIHALFAEGDRQPRFADAVQIAISIHALFAEGDHAGREVAAADREFLSTPSSQRATVRCHSSHLTSTLFLSTPSSQRATSYPSMRAALFGFLSTPSSQRATPIRAGEKLPEKFLSTPSSQRATCVAFGGTQKQQTFLSTPSSQRATDSVEDSFPRTDISIHALFAEGDGGGQAGKQARNISIHALFAEGDAEAQAAARSQAEFLSTPSSQRATFLPSFTASLAEYFYPRPLRRGRPRNTKKGAA